MRRLEDQLDNASTSEKVIAGIFEQYGIAYDYERQVLVEEDRGNKVMARLWYPDFYLRDYGIIIEFVGLPDDEAYMRGIERKRQIYENMGLKVVYINRDEMWEANTMGDGYRVRDDFEINLIRKIQQYIDEGENQKLTPNLLQTSGSPNHDYSGSSFANG